MSRITRITRKVLVPDRPEKQKAGIPLDSARAGRCDSASMGVSFPAYPIPRL